MKRFLFAVVLTAPMLAQSTSLHDCYELRSDLTANVRQSEEAFSAFAESFGYVQGVAESLGHLQDEHGLKHVCLPREYRAGELTDVVVKYFNDHPIVLHEPRVQGVANALVAAYPCQETKP